MAWRDSRSEAGTGRRDSSTSMILYGRPGCHLCEVAAAELTPLLDRLGLVLEHRNVAADPEWERQYGHRVPAGVVNGELLFKYRVDSARLETALRRRGLC